MHISKIAVQNFRLLEAVELCLEKQTTVIVGQNNSGKTSLTELFKRLLEKSPRFKLEDFSLGVHEKFWEAFKLKQKGAEDNIIQNAIPAIKVELTIEYGDTNTDLGSLSDFIIDLNPNCTNAKVNISYALEKEKIQALFDDLESERLAFFNSIKKQIPKFFKTSIEAVDPNDPSNRKAIEFVSFNALLQSGFVNAQRALDDTTHTYRDDSGKRKAVLGKILEALFKAAASETASTYERDVAEELSNAVMDIQDSIDTNFNKQLGKLIPIFSRFGYPRLSDPKLRTETILKVEQLLSNHTTIGYEGINGVNLPESYNGLGPRNLIFILLKLYEFFKSFATEPTAPSVHLVFIEEPEAHLHPQMQTVFIRKLSEIANFFAQEYNNGTPWPVQFIVTTHSSHIANEATFDSIRYFLAQPRAESRGIFASEIKDLRLGLKDELEENREFLHKYMTLTRCDLFFADQAMLIEGPTERLLLPKMIEKVDGKTKCGELSSKYLTVIEVGGAYAHKFFNLLDFLNLRTLIITDLDTIDRNNNSKKCKVSAGTHSSNACINRWYSGEAGEDPTRDELLRKSEADKIKDNRRLAFQVPHSEADACGRSFESAFMLANPDIFGITGTTINEREDQAWKEAEDVNKKTDFALKYAIEETDWVVPLYIEEGLKWLAESPTNPPAAQARDEAEEAAPMHSLTEEEAGD